MTLTSPESSPGGPPCWRSPLSSTVYDRGVELSAGEREAIMVLLDRRTQIGELDSRSNKPQHDVLLRLLRPIQDALDIIDNADRRADRRAATAVLLRECLGAGTTFWAWDEKQWIASIGRTSLEFRRRNRGRLSQSVRVDIAAIAYLHGCFRDVLALGHFKRISLAKRVFGENAIAEASKKVAALLTQWGYAVGTALLSCLCEALLRNESPHLKHLTAEVLDRFRRSSPARKRSLYYFFLTSLFN